VGARGLSLFRDWGCFIFLRRGPVKFIKGRVRSDRLLGWEPRGNEVKKFEARSLSLLAYEGAPWKRANK